MLLKCLSNKSGVNCLRKALIGCFTNFLGDHVFRFHKLSPRKISGWSHNCKVARFCHFVDCDSNRFFAASNTWFPISCFHFAKKSVWVTFLLEIRAFGQTFCWNLQVAGNLLHWNNKKRIETCSCLRQNVRKKCFRNNAANPFMQCVTMHKEGQEHQVCPDSKDHPIAPHSSTKEQEQAPRNWIVCAAALSSEHCHGGADFASVLLT